MKGSDVIGTAVMIEYIATPGRKHKSSLSLWNPLWVATQFGFE